MNLVNNTFDMIKNVKIILKENPLYFVSGDTVRGLILLEVAESYEMFGYLIEAGYHIACSNRENFKTLVKTCESTPNIFNLRNTETKTLSNGFHFIQFEFKLPADTPSSFKVFNKKEYAFGASSNYYDYLFYYVKFCAFSTSERNHEKHLKYQFFQVIKSLNISDQKHKSLHSPATDSIRIQLRNGEEVFFKLETTKGAYVMNENIQFKLQITNPSRKKIKSIKCMLVQELKYKNVELNEITETKRAGKTSAEANIEWSHVLKVPANIPTTLADQRPPRMSLSSKKGSKKSISQDFQCNVSYYLQIKVAIGSLKKQKILQLPVVIGTASSSK